MTAVYERVAAIVGHTEFGQVGLVTCVPLSRQALVITGDGADRALMADLGRPGVEVRLV